MKEEEALNLMARSKKVIYFADKDIELLKRIGKQIEENFPGFEIVGMIKLEDIEDELSRNPPMVMILDFDLAPEDRMVGFIKKLRDHELFKKLPLIMTGPRQMLEQRSIHIERYELEIVPKSIRVPYLMAMISSAVHQASTVQSKLVQLQEGEYLFKEGDRGESIYVLREGSLEVIKHADGKDVVIAEIHDQQMIGEMAYLEKKLRAASIRAMTPSKVLELQLGDVDKFLEQQPFWLHMLLTTLITRVRDANTQIMSLQKEIRKE